MINIISGNKWIIWLQIQSITVANIVHRNLEKHFWESQEEVAWSGLEPLILSVCGNGTDFMSTLLSTRPHSGSVNEMLAWNEYMHRFKQAVENNRFPKSLISRKTMQFLENWSASSDAKWHTKCYDWVSTEGTQICGNYLDNGLTGHLQYNWFIFYECRSSVNRLFMSKADNSFQKWHRMENV